MSLALKGRECELYNESVVEPSDAVGAGKVITYVEELADQSASVEKKGSEGCLFFAALF